MEIVDLAAGYGRLMVLNGLSCTLAPGSITGIVGPNGAGKSTLLRTISGLIRPASGAIEHEGRRIDGLSPHRIARMGVSHVLEGRGLFPSLTVHDHLVLAARAGGRDGAWCRTAIQRVLTLFPALRSLLRQPAYALSGGEQQMLALGRALTTDPAVLLMDEPSTGLAPKIVESIFEVIAGFRGSRMAVLLVEQNVRIAASVADAMYVMHQGTLVPASGRLDDEAQEFLRQRYLGT